MKNLNSGRIWYILYKSRIKRLFEATRVKKRLNLFDKRKYLGDRDLSISLACKILFLEQY